MFSSTHITHLSRSEIIRYGVFQQIKIEDYKGMKLYN